MRSVLPLLTATAVALTLAACTAAPDDEGEGRSDATSAECEATASGPASDSVSVTGEVGAEPSVSIDAPLELDATERSVVVEGDGAAVEHGTTAFITFSLYNGRTGDVATSTGYGDGAAAQVGIDEAQTMPGLVKTVACSQVGDRVVGAVVAEDAFGENGYPEFAIEAGDPLVFVVDVVDVLPTRATGEEQPAPEGFPAVEFAEDGTPTVAIPDAEPPADLEIGVLREGDGATVGEGDSVTIHYQGVNWTTGEVFDQSWGQAPATFPTNGVISGFGEALVGQKVGSQVIAIIPPEEGYGPQGGNDEAGIAEDDTLVFVIDILRTQPLG